jgi:hypothetical protein
MVRAARLLTDIYPQRMATQILTVRLNELRERDRQGVLTEDEFVELIAAKDKPGEVARQQFRTLAQLRELPKDYQRTKVL